MGFNRREVLRLGSGAFAEIALLREVGAHFLQMRPTPPEPALATIKDLRALLAGADVDRELGWLEKSLKPGAPLPVMATVGLDDVKAALVRSSLMGPARTTIQALAAEDIRIKANYCRSSPLGMAAMVRLTVRTWSQEVTGRVERADWQVKYVSTPLTLLPAFVGRAFPRFSSPCEIDLPPGLWTLWAEHPADPLRRGPTKEVTLGQSPADAALAADVLVP